MQHDISNWTAGLVKNENELEYIIQKYPNLNNDKLTTPARERNGRERLRIENCILEAQQLYESMDDEEQGYCVKWKLSQ